MILTSIRVVTEQREYRLDNICPITVITGSSPSGKSRLLQIINKFVNNIDKMFLHIDGVSRLDVMLRLPEEATYRIKRKYDRKWDIDLSEWAGDVRLIYNIQQSLNEFICQVEGETVLHVVKRVADDTVVTNIRRPVSIELKSNVNTVQELYKIINESPHAHLLSEFEELLLVSTEFCKDVVEALHINTRALLIGPYVDYLTCVEPSDNDDELYVGQHGENTVRVLASLFVDGRVWPSLAKMISLLERMGIKRLRCGYRNGKIAISCLSPKGELVICPELPCSVKTLITYYTQLIAAPKYSIILIDNFDYCLSQSICEAFPRLLKDCVISKKCQIIAEVHNSDNVKCLATEYTVMYTI